jgi:hypothetical protein
MVVIKLFDEPAVRYPRIPLFSVLLVISNREFVSEQISAGQPFSSRSRANSRTAHFAHRRLASGAHGSGQGLAQVKIATRALGTPAGEAKHAPGVKHVDAIFHFPGLTKPGRVKVEQIHHQRFQVRKLCHERSRLLHSFLQLQVMFRPCV